MKKLLFVGPDCRLGSLNKGFYDSALSPAAVAWCSGFADALRAEGCDVDSFYHLPQPTWPRGPLLSRGDFVYPSPGLASKLYYLNVKGLRGLALERVYREALISRLKSGDYQTLITYNFSYENIAMGTLAKSYGLRWVAVFADGPKWEEVPYWGRRRSYPDALLTLSYAYHKEIEKGGAVRSVYFPGGIASAFLGASSFAVSPRRLIYTGSIHPVMGVDWMARAMRQTSGRFELHVCGKGFNATLDEVAKSDSRIVMHGLVGDDKLKEINQSAFAFINPRPSSIPENQYSFPSKLFSYLSYGRPVISTMTPGVSPEFAEALIVPDQETVEGLARAIESCMAMSERDWCGMAQKVETLALRYAWSSRIQLIKEQGVL